MYTPASRGNPPIRSRAGSEDRSRVRVFFAVRPPADLRQALGAIARTAAHETRGRAVPDDNLHLTLVFVGDVVASMLPTLSRIGASVAKHCADVDAEPCTGATLVLDRLDGFARARVAWLGPSSVPEPLVTLAHALERELDAAAIAYDRKPFRAHLTLARSCRGPFVARAIDPVTWQIDSLVLLRSPRGVSGGRYEAIGRWALTPGRV